MPSETRSPWLLSIFAFAAFAYFHSGGGWNQNARFAQLRAIVEQGTFAIDSYLVYVPRSNGGDSTALDRVPLERATLRRAGKEYALTWGSDDGPLVDPGAPATAERISLTGISASGDVAYRDAHFYPNKAPGPTMLALPAYALLVLVERWLGLDLDDAVVLNANLWFVSAWSIGVVAALAVGLFFVEAKRLTGVSSATAALATAAFAFGTPFFAYATLLYEHDLVAACLLAAYAAAARSHGKFRAAAIAGFFAAFAAASNYVAAGAAGFVFLCFVYTTRRFSAAAAFVAGALPVAALLVFWNVAAYGEPIVNHYEGEYPLYRTAGAWLGTFTMPGPGKLAAIFFSPFRGLFASAPILLLALFGFVRLLARRERRADALAALAVTLPFFGFTTFFEHWHGGGGFAPRYLIPALPFLALSLPLAFQAAYRTSLAVAALSIALNLLAVAVDPQTPIGVHGMATDPRRPVWSQSPIFDYDLPLFVRGRATPVLDGYRARRLEDYARQLSASNTPPDQRQRLLDEAAATIDAAIESRDRTIPLAAVTGPVSANVIGAYESGWFKYFPPGSAPVRSASSNAGELLFPESRLSLLPLLLAATLAAWMIRREVT